MGDNSDYNLPRTKLDQFLAEPYDSDVNKAVFENLFNRFLTKNETNNVSGYIGKGNDNAIVSRQIAEPTLHRQAFQLQPLLYNKLGSIEHISSWKDILNELERLGVDIDRLNEWGESKSFNWVPPIDIDKIIHYQDYFWVDSVDATSRPQYITIRDRCATATAKANFHQQLADNFGTEFPILALTQSSVTPTFVVQEINSITQFVRVSGNATIELSALNFFNITGASNTGEYQVLGAPVYDPINDWTVVNVNPGSFTSTETSGTLNIQSFDNLTITGDFTRLFDVGYVFFVKNSSNPELSDSFQVTAQSTFDDSTNTTVVTIDSPVTSSISSGTLSLQEQLDLFLSDRDCQCSGSIGWDLLGWDDNPSDPLWDGDLIPLLISISNTTGPDDAPNNGAGIDNQLWFDTTSDRLYQYGAVLGGWKLIWNNFQTIIDATEGLSLWDLTPNCGIQSKILGADQWVTQNKWVHKTDVTNFSIAKQASIPIIEYDWDLELNEWSVAEPVWKYRPEKFGPFVSTTETPSLFELVALDSWAIGTANQIILDEKYGNLTLQFSPGTKFQTQDTTDILETVDSVYESSIVGGPLQTKIEITIPVLSTSLTPGVSPLRPTKTSVGDTWKDYHDHWLFTGYSNATAINHQADNPFIVDDPTATIVTDANYDYTVTPYSQTYTVTSSTAISSFLLDNTVPATYRSLRRRALSGMDDIRVYVNDIRAYGTYEETTESVIVSDATTSTSETVSYVNGIQFIVGFEPQQFDVVRVEVGEASIKEFGLYAVPVRQIEDNAEFENITTGGPKTTSLISCRKVEQVKTDLNQYPLFDLYNTDGTTTRIANSIFEFLTSSDADINTAVGLRLVVDATSKDFSFQQLLCNPTTKDMYAYRDYSNVPATYWVNLDNNVVRFWSEFSWDVNGYQGMRYQPATVSPDEPTSPFDGQVWLNTLTQQLFEYQLSSFVLIDPANINNITYDITLQSVWKQGLNDETYVPSKVDEKNRTLVEYNAQQELFVTELAEELILADQSLSLAAATLQATNIWYAEQSSLLSPTGVWLGDWEIPDPLYFNNQHENRKVLKSSELLSHFNSIIAAQPDIPAFNGPDSSRFHLIRTEEVNYGLGGLIKEYNGNFDTLLSSVFNNNVTPITLIQFARDQYESLINNITETLHKHATELMLDIGQDSLFDFEAFASEFVLTTFEQNDNLSFLYGDSTTFTEGSPDTGLRNFIATLPYLKLLSGSVPNKIVDTKIGVHQISHHDSHRNDYNYEPAILDGLARSVISTVDGRSTLVAPNNTMGKLSTTLPPNNKTEFESLAYFNENINNRPGVYWYNVVGADRTLYRLNVVAISNGEPSVSLADGSLWFDITPSNEVLRIKNGTSWDVVSGLVVGDGRLHNGIIPGDITTSTVSAWQEFDLDAILLSTILSAETKLYENIPETVDLNFDFTSLQSTVSTSALYDRLLQDGFLDYTRRLSISAPLQNVDFDQTDSFTWNYKRSTTGVGYDIIQADDITSSFVISGNVALAFPVASTFFVKNGGANDGQWTVVSTTEALGNTTIVVTGSVVDSIVGIIYKGLLPSNSNTGGESGGDWKDLYSKIYNTPYPHLEPWKLQQYSDKPSWWDITYKNDDIGTYGPRRWKYIHATTTGMWENIRLGIVPVGELLSNMSTISTGTAGEAITYNYFSVNISDGVISSNGGTTNYAADDILPPFFDHVSAGELLSSNNRSMFQSFSTEITSPGANFLFGDAGPIEYDWRTSSQFLYDQSIVAFKMEPMAYYDSVFGFNTNIIGGLNIDSTTNQTPCHCRTDFHGDVIGDSVVIVDGLNQWYVNFNRFQGYDSSLSDFRNLWTLWTAPLSYQFSSFVDTSSLQVAHRTVPFTEFDYSVTSKRSPGAEDFWVDAFDVRVLNIPPSYVRYDNQLEWLLEVDTNSPLNRSITHYDVHNYQFSANPTTDVCTLYSYLVQSVDVFNETITVLGDQTAVFGSERNITIAGSTGNDNNYIVIGSVYDSTADNTIIELDSALLSNVADGSVIADYRQLPWNTGDGVWFSTDETLPTPIQGDQKSIGPTRYFIIKISDNEFKIANTQQNALANLPIDIVAPGRRNSYVGEIVTTFNALGGERTDTIWRHYRVDKNSLLTFTPPISVRGMQTLVNMVDGYEQYAVDQGFRFNDNNQTIDPDTGRFVGWQVEMERFITFAYGLRSTQNVNITNRFEATVDDSTDTWTWNTTNPQFVTGTPVNVVSANTIYPSPLISALKYYIIVQSDTTFKLAGSRTAAEQGVAIDITANLASGVLYITNAATFRDALPSQQINPFRNQLYFRPPRGIVSNVLTGPSEDIRNTQLLFDQYGRPLNREQIKILRQDKLTQILITDNIPNDIELTSPLVSDPYNFLHLGGARIFIDAYEHVLLFNNNTTEGALLYDPFLGLNVTKFEMLFDKQKEFTQRPNVGGSYFKTFFNQGAELVDNFESAIENLRTLYDVHQTVESKEIVKQSRRSLGYEGTKDYLDNMNLNEKSQFLFWRGLIQHKGSLQSVNAFVNSRRFIDAKVDEFWAIKIAEFGSTNDKEYPELFLTSADARSNDISFQFVEEGDFCQAGFGEDGFDSPTCGFDISTEDAISVDPGFTPIALVDQSRWHNQPDQLDILRNNGLALYFDLHTTNTFGVITSTVQPLLPIHNQGWIDSSAAPTYTFNRYDAATSAFVYHGSWNSTAGFPIIRHDFISDNEVVVVNNHPVGSKTIHVSSSRTSPVIPGQLVNSFDPGGKVVSLLNDYIPFTGNISVMRNGTELVELVEYVQTVDGFGSLTNNEIVVVGDLNANDVIEIVYLPSTLLVNTHYERINSKVMKLLYNELVANNITMSFWGQVLNEDAQNVAKLIDIRSEVVVTPVQFWDPARNVHYKNVLSEIKLEMADDPAVYTNTIETNQTPPGSDVRPYVLYNAPWNDTEVGTTWLDTSNIDYKPYYDVEAVPDKDDRLRQWGVLSEWASLNVYEWIESPVPPEEYNQLATEQEGDRDIPEHLRNSGRVREVLFELFGSDWIPLKNKKQIFDVSIDGTETIVGTYQFTLQTITNNINIGDVIDVYVDGKLVQSDIVATAIFSISDLVEANTVTLVKLIPTDSTIISAGVDAGTLSVQMEHTIQVDYDEFEQPFNKYYFWVESKGTRNRNQKIAPVDVQSQLIQTPSPYLIASKPLPADVRDTGVLVDLDRSWNHVISQSDLDRFAQLGRQVILLGAAVKSNDISNISVTVNGTALIPTTEFSISATGREFEISTPVAISDTLVVEYVTEIPTEVFSFPDRHIQLIIRGLRGIVTTDRRFVLRFTRDFTLREDLNKGVTPLDMKQNHEEWQLFREQQLTLIPRNMWDRITESLVGFKLTDTTIRVPSLERELYDATYQNDTRFGIGDGQTFTDGPTSLQTILADLTNPLNQFESVDINSFFALNNFDSNDSIIESMDTIYNSFTAPDVNRIYFAVLHDAFSFKLKYKDIFKTSMVAVHGIRPFQVDGVFDD